MTSLAPERDRELTRATRVESNREGFWVERTSQNETLREVVIRRPLPMQLIRRYVALGIRRATIVQHEDGAWWAEIREFPGVWAKELSAKDALGTLEEVAFEWALLKIQDGDRDFATLDGVDLNTV